MSLKEAEAKDKYIFLIENSYINKGARNSCIYNFFGLNFLTPNT